MRACSVAWLKRIHTLNVMCNCIPCGCPAQVLVQATERPPTKPDCERRTVADMFLDNVTLKDPDSAFDVSVCFAKWYVFAYPTASRLHDTAPWSA